jgi:hypothetical protein
LDEAKKDLPRARFDEGASSGNDEYARCCVSKWWLTCVDLDCRQAATPWKQLLLELLLHATGCAIDAILILCLK